MAKHNHKALESYSPVDYYWPEFDENGHRHFHVSVPIEFNEFDEEVKSLVYLLRSARPSDYIYIYVGGNGGSVGIGMKIIHAMKATKAELHVTVDSDCMSMHSLVALACRDHLIIEPNILFMIHEGSLGADMNPIMMMDYAEANTRMIRQIDIAILGDILTKAEFVRMRTGLDLYFTGEEIIKRLGDKK